MTEIQFEPEHFEHIYVRNCTIVAASRQPIFIGEVRDIVIKGNVILLDRRAAGAQMFEESASILPVGPHERAAGQEVEDVNDNIPGSERDAGNPEPFESLPEPR